MKTKLKASSVIFFLGSVLLFAKFWHEREASLPVWWLEPLFVQLYFLLFFGGGFLFLAFLFWWAINKSRADGPRDEVKLLTSALIFVFGWAFAFINRWQTAITLSSEPDMWWQNDLLVYLYIAMFIGGFSATVVMLLKIGVYKIRDHFRQRKSDQNVEQQG